MASGSFITVQNLVDGVLPVCLTGPTRCVREGICLIFKTICDTYCGGNMEAVGLPVQFKEYQVICQISRKEI